MPDIKLPLASVTIDLLTYTDFVKAHTLLNMVLDAFYQNCQMCCGELQPSLDFSRLVRLIDTDTYDRTLKLMEEQNNE